MGPGRVFLLSGRTEAFGVDSAQAVGNQCVLTQGGQSPESLHREELPQTPEAVGSLGCSGEELQRDTRRGLGRQKLI